MEIDEITKGHGGQITYSSVGEMKYLEACIDGNTDELYQVK